MTTAVVRDHWPALSGKTTALLNAGLSFPLAAEMGQGPIAGVGGLACASGCSPTMPC